MSAWRPARPVRYDNLSKKKRHGGSDRYRLEKASPKAIPQVKPKRLSAID